MCGAGDELPRGGKCECEIIEWNVQQIDSGGLEDWLLLSVKKEKMERKVENEAEIRCLCCEIDCPTRVDAEPVERDKAFRRFYTCQLS